MPYSNDPRRGYYHAGAAVRRRNWITAKAREDPPCLGVCPWCMETVRKAGGRYLDFIAGAFVPHRHQPRKLDGTGEDSALRPGRPQGGESASDSD